MSDEDSLAENIRIASDMLPNSMSNEELKAINTAITALKAKRKIPCTGCGYCMPCPFGVDIPECFNNYNDIETFSKREALITYIGFTSGLSGGKNSGASQCTKCGKCITECPQDIDIPAKLNDVKRTFEGFLYKCAMIYAKMRSKKRNKKA
jgi:hypothetical protein